MNPISIKVVYVEHLEQVRTSMIENRSQKFESKRNDSKKIQKNQFDDSYLLVLILTSCSFLILVIVFAYQQYHHFKNKYRRHQVQEPSRSRKINSSEMTEKNCEKDRKSSRSNSFIHHFSLPDVIRPNRQKRQNQVPYATEFWQRRSLEMQRDLAKNVELVRNLNQSQF